MYVHNFFLVLDDKKHRALLTTCERTIVPGGCVLVFYTHHRPHLAPRDMDFFKIAAETSWKCEEVFTERFPVRVSRVHFVPMFRPIIIFFFSYCNYRRQPMFPEDPGEEEVRSTVHGWKLTRVSP
jgi:EEF1A N-terminal glycine/lysine methyltransferase